MYSLASPRTPNITQIALVKFSWFQNKTKRHECEKAIVKEEGRDWQVEVGDKRMESKSNQNALYKHMKLLKPSLI